MIADVALPIVAAALIWWLGTCAILWLVRLPDARRRAAIIIATAAMLGAMATAVLLKDVDTIAAAYGGFAAGVVLWGWHELMFLMGYITGPNRSACPPNLKPWRRFAASANTIIHHEIAIALHAGLLVWLSWGGANQVAAWTFLLLWGMRLSAKLIVFFGAPNVNERFLPARLSYLHTYFARRTNFIFTPLAMIAVTLTAGILIHQAAVAPGGSFAAAGLSLVASLAALAVIEHLALVAPVPDDALWDWAIGDAPLAKNTKSLSDGGHP
ncbi:MAG: putative photosynthetic complex assembly protein PuhE [Pseudomonadota bacterium]